MFLLGVVIFSKKNIFWGQPVSCGLLHNSLIVVEFSVYLIDKQLNPPFLQILNNTSTNYQKKQIMKCKLGMKKMKKYYPEKDCTKVAVGLDKKCFDMVKLQEEKHEVKKCSFHPKTVCRLE